AATPAAAPTPTTDFTHGGDTAETPGAAKAPVVSRSPDRATAPTEDLPALPQRRHAGAVARSGDRDTTGGAEPPGAAEAANQTVDLRSTRTAGTGGMTVLLVEPSRSQAVIIRGYLQTLGFRNIPTTSSGQKALEIARNAPPRVVISAMHLADMTGVQLAQQMRAEEPLSSTGFVLITSQADVQEASLPGQAGSAVRLPKPFDLDHPAGALAAATGGPQRQTGPASPGVGQAGKPDLRVLVVDDSAAARSHIRNVLAGLGLRQVVEAADGAEAVSLL